MSDWSDREEADKRRLWEYILATYYGVSDMRQFTGQQDSETYLFFRAVEKAFEPCEKTGEFVSVNQALLQHMAAWGRAVTYDHKILGGNPLDRRNHFIFHAFEGFIATLRLAVIRKQLQYLEDGRILYGRLEIPPWFLDKCIGEAWVEAERLNERCDESPRFREHVSKI